MLEQMTTIQLFDWVSESPQHRFGLYDGEVKRRNKKYKNMTNLGYTGHHSNNSNYTLPYTYSTRGSK